jgi:Thioredoxin-like
MDGEIMLLNRQIFLTSFLSLALFIISGCGSSDSNSESSKSTDDNNSEQTIESKSSTETKNQKSESINLETAAIPNPTASNTTAKGKKEEVKKDDPLIVELRSIHALRRKPFPETKDPKKLAELKLVRYREVIDQLIPIIGKTLADPEREVIFLESIRTMIDTRLKAALLGDQEQIDALYDDAESMYKKSKTSPAVAKAAPDAGLAVVHFSHAIARSNSKQIPEFTKQARLFATRFPKYKTFTVPLLYSAAWSAELHKMNDEAINCYTMIRDEFPDTRQAIQSTAILRRLTLPGKSAQISGSTIDGDLWNLDNHKGKIVMVVFWDSKTDQFQDICPDLVKISGKYEKYGLRTVGINLDKDESEANIMIEKYNINWPQIFYPEPNKRRWNNPMVVYYGVRDIPAVWLIDHSGIVTSTNVKMEDIDKQVKSLLIKKQKSKKSKK